MPGEAAQGALPSAIAEIECLGLGSEPIDAELIDGWIIRRSVSMNRRWMRPGRGLAVGLVAAAAGLAALPRSATEAQEPDRPSARAALRRKIADLRGDVELRELEHDAEREILKTKILSVPALEKQITDAAKEVQVLSESRESEVLEAKDHYVELAWRMKDEEAAKALAAQFDEAIASKKPFAIKKVILKFLDGAESLVKAEADRQLNPLKKEFARHATELCARKLELEDLERQYRDSR